MNDKALEKMLSIYYWIFYFLLESITLSMWFIYVLFFFFFKCLKFVQNSPTQVLGFKNKDKFSSNQRWHEITRMDALGLQADCVKSTLSW